MSIQMNKVENPASTRFIVVSEDGIIVKQTTDPLALIGNAKILARAYSNQYKKAAYVFKAVWKAEPAVTLTETDL